MAHQPLSKLASGAVWWAYEGRIHMSDKMNNDNKREPLHEIVARSNALAEMLLRAGGELTPELEAEVDSVGRSLVTKVDSCAIVLDRLDAEATLWSDRAKQYQRIAKSLETAHGRIRDMLKAAMRAMDVTEIVGDETRFALVNGKAKVVIDEDALDQSYLMERREWVVDKDRVDSDLRQGTPVTGAHLEDVMQLRKYAATRRGK